MENKLSFEKEIVIYGNKYILVLTDELEEYQKVYFEILDFVTCTSLFKGQYYADDHEFIRLDGWKVVVDFAIESFEDKYKSVKLVEEKDKEINKQLEKRLCEIERRLDILDEKEKIKNDNKDVMKVTGEYFPYTNDVNKSEKEVLDKVVARILTGESNNEEIHLYTKLINLKSRLNVLEAQEKTLQKALDIAANKL